MVTAISNIHRNIRFERALVFVMLPDSEGKSCCGRRQPQRASGAPFIQAGKSQLRLTTRTRGRGKHKDDLGFCLLTGPCLKGRRTSPQNLHLERKSSILPHLRPMEYALSGAFVFNRDHLVCGLMTLAVRMTRCHALRAKRTE
ncbi:hypothetical protein SCP_0404340 [Sparassis crispa]|uniref:Uncharacterized protein n=1 Tax=Sparassis crispa TaxID=139825 RepID=A0A401GIP4_9APHY|nr:hypothetical protein SCP_0404340 [Sparassis crispa]GBE82056.1 hypothetical protein SCP_0404340 [Sparassis crispa]